MLWRLAWYRLGSSQAANPFQSRSALAAPITSPAQTAERVEISAPDAASGAVGIVVLSTTEDVARTTVGASVRASVGASVGAEVRALVGTCVGASVGTLVGALVGAPVRTAVAVSQPLHGYKKAFS